MADVDNDLELVRGSGNVFADFGAPDASLRQFHAEARTGIAAADFSRIRQVKLDRFTIDRLMRILDRLNRDVLVKISVAPRGRSLGRNLPSPLAA
jgi:hypothetical protein